MDKPICSPGTLLVAALATVAATAYASLASYDALTHIDAPRVDPSKAIVAAPAPPKEVVAVAED